MPNYPKCNCGRQRNAQSERCNLCTIRFRNRTPRAYRYQADRSVQAQDDPEGWAEHLERLAARAAAGLPLFG